MSAAFEKKRIGYFLISLERSLRRTKLFSELISRFRKTEIDHTGQMIATEIGRREFIGYPYVLRFEAVIDRDT